MGAEGYPMTDQPTTLPTKEARAYIAQRIGQHTLHLTQLHRYRRYGWITPHEIGTAGAATTYTVEALDRLCAKIKEMKRVYKQKQL